MSLPIVSALPSLLQALTDRDEAILVAAPGAGKTTLVPLALLDQPWLEGQRILMLEPRRLAARMAAQRMAENLGERPGETVGYRMRLDSKESRATRILVITEGVLTRMLQSDPSLDGYGLLIFDEYHERSLDGDLGLALSLYSRSLFREVQTLKLLLMSATLDSVALATLLNDAPVIRSEGRAYPVAVHYGTSVARRDLVAEAATAVCTSLAQDSGSLLVFLPGQGEIRALLSLLQGRVSEQTLLVPLYGDLNLDAQRRAIEPAAKGFRKVVMATNIAESSLTIEGVNVVIDSGYTRAPQFDPRSGMTRLQTVRVSRASAEQRAGRAGRLGPGVAYRLWSEMQTLAAFSEPEIAQADLAPLALQLLQWGVEPGELTWLEVPRAAPYQQAMELLQRLGACTATGQITAHGEAMAALPVHPRLAHMLLRSRDWGNSDLACELAAILAERDPAPDAGADIAERLTLLALPSDRQPLIKRLRQQAAQYRRVLDRFGKSEAEVGLRSGREGLLLALAYPDRIARQRTDGSTQYLLANGRSASLRDDDPLRNKPWLAVAQLGGHAGQAQDRIYLAAEFEPRWLDSELSDLLQRHDIAEWRDDGKLLIETQHRLGRVLVKRDQAATVDEKLSKAAVVTWLRDNGLEALPWSDFLRQWQSRVMCLRTLAGDADDEWPDVSDAWLQQHLEQWLNPFLPVVSHRRHLKKVDLQAALFSLLPWPLPQRLDDLAPTHMTVPTGSRVAIDYGAYPPVLAVKLQEMFGQKATPAIAGGRLPLLLHLLSPGKHPLQVTRDLESFWQNAYTDVKRDMRGRYPKHPWPDDPLNAVPKRGTKKQGV